MSPQGVVTKNIINSCKAMVKSFYKKISISLLSIIGIVSILTQSHLLSNNIMAYAQQQAPQLIDPMSEVLKESETKVAIATSPGAFGNGVPGLYNIPLLEFLIGLGIAGALCICIYYVTEWLLTKMKRTTPVYYYQ